MKKYYLLSLLIAVSTVTFAQYMGSDFTLNENVPSNQTREYIASDYIKLVNNGSGNGGFNAKPDAGKYVSLQSNPMLIFPPYTGQWGGPPDNNNGGGVGTLPGKFKVSSTGAAVYSMPIELPDGIAGLQPNLGLEYNSQAGDGIIGPRWMLKGLSSISRVPFTYYYNGFTGHIDMNNDAQLMIDGNYLFRDDNGIYHAEVENFSIITPVDHDKLDNGFIVKKKNGMIYEYGTTDDSRYFLQGGAPIEWYLCKIIDTKGNYIEFHYKNEHDFGSFYPDYILYTGTNNKVIKQDPFYRIDFKYMVYNREDSPKKYFSNPKNPAPFFSNINKLLSEITITYLPSQKEIKRYSFIYNKNEETGVRYLTGIAPEFEYNGQKGMSSLNYTKFEWLHSNCEISKVGDNSYWLRDVSELSTFAQIAVYGANFDDNPTTDLLHVSKLDKTRSNWFIREYFNQSGYVTNGNFYYNFENPTSMKFTHLYNKNPSLYIAPGDFNGDGISEILRIGAEKQLLSWEIGMFDEMGNYQITGNGTIASLNIDFDQHNIFTIGDFDGNGYDDLFFVAHSDGDKTFVSGFVLSKKDNPLSTIVNCNMNISPDKIFVGDFNGNNKKEILALFDASNKSIIYKLNSSSNDVLTDPVPHDIEQDFDKYFFDNELLAGDFNNDAKTDIVRIFENTEDNKTSFQFYFSYGTGRFVKSNIVEMKTIGGIEDHAQRKLIADINGDGYKDICFVKKTTIQENYSTFDLYTRKDLLIRPHFSDVQITENDFQENLAKVKRYSGYFWPYVNFCMGNFSGNSNGQLITARLTNNKNKINLLLNLTAPIYTPYIDAVTSIINGLGEEKRIHYLPLFAVPIYASSAAKKPLKSFSAKALPFPLTNNPGLITIVTSYEQEIEQEKFLSIYYYYRNPKYHKLGKGFLGFEQITEKNELKRTEKKAFYTVDENRFYPYNNKTEIYSIASQYYPLIAINEYAYGFRDYNVNNKLRFFPFLVSSKQNTYDLESFDPATPIKRHKTIYEDYDDFGNPKKVTDYYGNGSSGWPISNVTNMTYLNLNNGNVYKTGLITDKTVTYFKTGQENKISKTSFDYFAASGLLKNKTIEPLNPKNRQFVFEYDDFGNLNTTTLKGADVADRVTRTNYTADGRFIHEKINALNQKITFDYYDKTGLLKTKTDENNLTTLYEYNIFGEITKIVEPDGNVTRVVKRWSIPGTSYEHEDAPENAYYYVWKKRSGGAEQLTFYDQFNKINRKVSIGLNGSKIYTDNIYHGKIEGDASYLSGLLFQSSLPYFKGQSTELTTYYYDKLQRTKKITKPDGSYSTIDHEGNTKTVRDFDGQTKKLEYNGAGWLTKVTNNNLTSIAFKHYSNGLEHETKINGIEETKISKYYDDFGNMTLLDDYNKLGSVSYIYNSFGEIDTKTDEKGRVSNFIYDKLGRMITRTSPDGVTRWQYDTRQHGIGKIDYVDYTPADGHVTSLREEHAYDDYSRETMKKQILNGKALEFDYVYDVHNRIKTVAYPTGYSITNYYNNNGYLFEKRDNRGKTVWHANTMNANGKYTGYKLGNEIVATKVYNNSSGLINNLFAGNHGNTTNIQSFSYGWLPEGNLEYRTDDNKNITESFLYNDSFNRLTETRLNNNLQLTINYDNAGLGNITSKSDVGNYTYGVNPGLDAGPYAVTGVDDPLNVISPETQTITYTSFEKIKHVDEGNKSLDACYDFNRSKIWQQLTVDNTTTTKRYFNNMFETETDNNGNIKNIHYLTAPDGLFAIFVADNNNVETLNYILKDHLGSPVYVLNEYGTVLEEQNFDPWGRRRNPLTWSYNNVSQTHLFDRGFTGHEQLDAFKLIDMKGRAYDPFVARFLSVDPTIQFPQNSQSYNRYSYALNNPLKFTDPSGFFLDWFINEITGAVYYNNTYTKGDEDKIKGEGWTWFGNDNVFGKDALQVLWENGNLLATHNMNAESGKSIVSFNVEASLKGQKALTFMKKMGYEFKPKVYQIHDITKTVYYPDAILITQKYQILHEKHVISRQYVPQTFSLKNTIVRNYLPPKYGKMSKYTWFDPSFSFTDETWKEYQDFYSKGFYIDRYLKKGLYYIEETGFPYKDILKEYWEQRFK